MRTKAERLKNTWKKIQRKLNLVKAKGVFTENEQEFIKQPHRLSKDKNEKRQYNHHTNNKTKRHIHGNYQRSYNPSTHDQRQNDSMNNQLKEHSHN